MTTATVHTHPMLQMAIQRASKRSIATRTKQGTQLAYWDVTCDKWIVERTNNDGQREQFAGKTLHAARHLAAAMLPECIA